MEEVSLEIVLDQYETFRIKTGEKILIFDDKIDVNLEYFLCEKINNLFFVKVLPTLDTSASMLYLKKLF